MANTSQDGGARNRLSPWTRTAQALGGIDGRTRALVPPVHVSTTFERDADGGYSSGRGYTRPHSPSYDEPEALLAELEGAEACLLLASGMAAATAVFQALLPGDHVLAPHAMYWTLRKWLVESALSWGLAVEFVDTGDLDAVERAMRPGKTRIVWLETPANPTWRVADIAAICSIAHAARARVVVDNTVATPVLTRPIEHGADIVVHSATKYLNGHSDVLAGAVLCKHVDAFWERIRAWRRDAGAVLGPFEAWLLLRGMRTLFLRVDRASQTALEVAHHLESHPAVSHVLYPGLKSDPDHALAATQMQGGFSGMLSFRHVHGEAGAMACAAAVQVFKRATSLGGVESLIEHRASIEGPATPVPDDLLRLSIGIEAPADLIADLTQALDQSLALTNPPVQTTPASQAASARNAPLAKVEAFIQDKLRPLLLDRGGDLRALEVTEQRITLEVSGSPGATIPVRAHIEALFKHYISAADISFVSPGSVIATQTADASLEERVRSVLDSQVNPTIASHGGKLRLDAIKGNTLSVAFEGRCQGCAMADVTLRQGVEVILQESLDEPVVVVDVTDHNAGTSPYFKTKKS